MGECLITAVSGGSWVLRGDVWAYQGKQVSSGLLTPESILYMDLVKIIRSKLRMEENIILKLSYYPLALPGISPIYVACDEDFEAYRFSNSREKVFQTPLYCEVETVEDEVKPFVIVKTEEIEVLSSAPEVETETQAMVGEKQVHDRKRKRENKTIPIEFVCLLTDEEKEVSDGEHDHSLLEISNGGSEELDVVDLNDSEDVDGDLSDDSYLWRDKFVEKSSAKSARVACDGAGFNRAVIDLVDDSCNDVEDDEEEYNQDFFKELDEAELRALRSHHLYVEANVVQDDGAMSGSGIRLGALYEDKESLKNAIVEYAVNNCFETRLKRSEPTRLFVGCKVRSCLFRINATNIPKTSKFKVYNFKTEHSCGLKYTHIPGKKATTSYVASKILQWYNLGKKMLSEKAIQTVS